MSNANTESRTGNENSTGQAMKRMAVGIVVLVVATALLYFVAGDGFYLWAKAIHVIAVIAWRRARCSPRPSR